jgi:ABC-type uncharacterized transport system substrate-binding protein
MRRRDFLNFLGTAAAAWPIFAHAQQSERLRRIGVLIPFPDDNETQVKARLSAFKQRLHELGWIESRNIRFNYRFSSQDAERIYTGAQELIALGPSVIVAWGNFAAAILQKATQTIPIVFVGVSDPVGGGFVTNLARPGGNSTGFQNFETAIGGKWLATNQDRIIALASDLKLPAIYPFRYFATNGGLASYGFDTVEPHRDAASYVDRILKGEKPGNLPVQAPTKYELVINLKTAKVLGLTVSREMQLRADELIE